MDLHLRPEYTFWISVSSISENGLQNSISQAKVKVKVEVHTLDIAPLRNESPPPKRSSMARVLKGFHRRIIIVW